MTEAKQVVPTSIEEAVEAWDRGDAVRTVSMGGLGDGYEWAIQAAMIEVLRAVIADPEFRAQVTEPPNGTPFSEELKNRLWGVITGADERGEDDRYKLGGLSGAQGGAAINLALVFIRRGFEALNDAEIADRLIWQRDIGREAALEDARVPELRNG